MRLSLRRHGATWFRADPFEWLIRAAGALAVLLFATVTPASAEPALSKQEGDEVRKIVRDYLLQHPEVVEEAIEVLQARRQAARIQKFRPEIENPRDAVIGGNPKGDVTVVEFFDYRCGYCKSVRESVARLRKEDPNIRFIYREFAILGPESERAARAAIASRKQNKYTLFHEALMAARGGFSDEMIFGIAKRTGLDVERLRKDMQDPAIDEILDRTRQLAEALEISGTPGFLFGTELVPGAISYDGMKQLVAKARAAKR